LSTQKEQTLRLGLRSTPFFFFGLFILVRGGI
jgi:hypothetical protein